MSILRAVLATVAAGVLCCPAAAAAAGWSEAGGIGIGRVFPEAMTLADGSVLVTGGGEADTRRFDPATDPANATWPQTGSMLKARTEFTVTRLLDGRVLAVGGLVPNENTVGTAELYDPVTGTWSAAAAMSGPRVYHSATLLDDGRVLVAGGKSGTSMSSPALSTAELYDPATNTWAPAASMRTTHSDPVATLLGDSRVWVSGELYDPATNTWSPGQGGGDTANLLPDGTVLMISGNHSNVYDPARNAVDPGPTLPLILKGPTATTLPRGDVLLAGGYNAQTNQPVATSWRYRHATRTWVPAGDLHEARGFHAATALPDGRVIVAGGSDGAALASAELWTPPVTTVGAPASVDFGAVSAATDQTVTVTNTGSDELLVDGLAVSGAAFAVSADTCSPAPVAAGASCTVMLRFTPPAPGAHSGALTFSANTTAGGVTVPLSGSSAPVTSPTPVPTVTPKKPQVTKPVNVRVRVSGHVRGRSRCRGKATLTLLAGTTRVGLATVRPNSHCRYSKTFKVRSDKIGTRKRLTLRVRYAGRTSRVTVKLSAGGRAAAARVPGG